MNAQSKIAIADLMNQITVEDVTSIEKIAEECLKRLCMFKLNQRTHFSFPKRHRIDAGHPGIYIVWKGNTPIYVGESRCIQDRYGDLHRTVNHTLRRQIGKTIYGETASSKRKFPDTIERKLDNYFSKHLSMSFVPVYFGRIEIQDEIIKILQLNHSLYNDRISRGTKIKGA